MTNIIRTGPGRRNKGGGSALHWLARISSVAVVILLVVMLTGENGSGPTGRDTLYLALFPVGFSLGYLIGWRWPLPGGVISLSCMALSLFVVGRTFDLETYMGWALFSLPGVLFVFAGLRSNGPSKSWF